MHIILYYIILYYIILGSLGWVLVPPNSVFPRFQILLSISEFLFPFAHQDQCTVHCLTLAHACIMPMQSPGILVKVTRPTTFHVFFSPKTQTIILPYYIILGKATAGTCERATTHVFATEGECRQCPLLPKARLNKITFQLSRRKRE